MSNSFLSAGIVKLNAAVLGLTTQEKYVLTQLTLKLLILAGRDCQMPADEALKCTCEGTILDVLTERFGDIVQGRSDILKNDKCLLMPTDDNVRMLAMFQKRLAFLGQLDESLRIKLGQTAFDQRARMIGKTNGIFMIIGYCLRIIERSYYVEMTSNQL